MFLPEMFPCSLLGVCQVENGLQGLARPQLHDLPHDPVLLHQSQADPKCTVLCVSTVMPATSAGELPVHVGRPQRCWFLAYASTVGLTGCIAFLPRVWTAAGLIAGRDVVRTLSMVTHNESKVWTFAVCIG